MEKQILLQQCDDHVAMKVTLHIQFIYIHIEATAKVSITEDIFTVRSASTEAAGFKIFIIQYLYIY